MKYYSQKCQILVTYIEMKFCVCVLCLKKTYSILLITLIGDQMIDQKCGLKIIMIICLNLGNIQIFIYRI